jgi:hypothetical protein
MQTRQTCKLGQFDAKRTTFGFNAIVMFRVYNLLWSTPLGIAMVLRKSHYGVFHALTSKHFQSPL